MAAKLHLAEDALALHLFLERLEGLIDVVVTDENLHAACPFSSSELNPGTVAWTTATGTPVLGRANSRNNAGSPPKAYFDGGTTAGACAGAGGAGPGGGSGGK